MKFKHLFLTVFLCINVLSFSQEKKIITIEIKGVEKTKKQFIEKLLSTKSGATLDSTNLNLDIVTLKRLPAISHAYYQVFHSHKNLYNVFISVEENHTLIPDVNFWSAINKKFAYKLGLYEYNFLGNNITLGGFYQNNGFDSYALNFKAPNLFSKKWGIAFNHQNWKSEEPLYFNSETANYLYNNISYEVLGLYQLNFTHQIRFGINFFNEKYTFLSGAVDASIPKNLDLEKRLLKFVYEYDTLDYYYQYISGFKSVFYGQYVNTTSTLQNDFFIGWNDFLFYKRIGNKGNWANRLRVGLASNEESPFAPFAIDNQLNLRGVGILVDRGTGSIVLNTEYRHTLYDKKWLAIQSNTFVDAGSWRNPGGTLNDFLQHENIKVYSGIGLRFISKKIYNATFRIDYGFNILQGTSGGFIFGIGQYF